MQTSMEDYEVVKVRGRFGSQKAQPKRKLQKQAEK
jgi:hypothetical protein